MQCRHHGRGHDGVTDVAERYQQNGFCVLLHHDLLVNLRFTRRSVFEASMCPQVLAGLLTDACLDDFVYAPGVLFNV
jgi:hypothetical protein